MGDFADDCYRMATGEDSEEPRTRASITVTDRRPWAVEWDRLRDRAEQAERERDECKARAERAERVVTDALGTEYDSTGARPNHGATLIEKLDWLRDEADGQRARAERAEADRHPGCTCPFTGDAPAMHHDYCAAHYGFGGTRHHDCVSREQYDRDTTFIRRQVDEQQDQAREQYDRAEAAERELHRLRMCEAVLDCQCGDGSQCPSCYARAALAGQDADVGEPWDRAKLLDALDAVPRSEVDDLRRRIHDGIARLSDMAASFKVSDDEYDRLKAKVSGLALAADYMRSMPESVDAGPSKGYEPCSHWSGEHIGMGDYCGECGSRIRHDPGPSDG